MSETTERSVDVSAVHPVSDALHRPDGTGAVEHASSLTKEAAPETVFHQLTVEHLLYGVIFAAAILLRWIGLGAEPLSPQESAAAWSAWLAANQQFVSGASAPESALLYGLQTLLFWLLGDGDALARAIPTLFGTATVLLPWFWRPWIGRTAALTAAALFAIDPWLTAFSRRSDSAALTIFLGLLVLTAIWHRLHAVNPSQMLRWERTAAVAGALFLTSGPLMWGMLFVLAFFLLIYGGSRQNQLAGARANEAEDASSLQPLHRSTWLWFGIPLALAATGLTLRFEALSALSASLTAWVTKIGFADPGGVGGVAHPLTWPFVRLLLDQPLLATFGILGLIGLWIRAVAPSNAQRPGAMQLGSEPAPKPGEQTPGPAEQPSRPFLRLDERFRLPIFLSAWVIWGLLLWLLPGRPPDILPLVGMPLAIAAALWIGSLFHRFWEGLAGLELFTLLVVQVVLLVASAIWLAALVDGFLFNESIRLTASVLVGLMIAIWILFGFWAGWRPTGRVALVYYAVLLGALTIRSGWQLNHTSGLMQPDGFWPAQTHPEIRLLIQDVERLSAIRRGDPHEIEVHLVYNMRPDPALGWNLRKMRNLHHVRSLDATVFDMMVGAQGMPLVIAPTSRNTSLPLPDPYIGSDYDVVYTWQPSMLPGPQPGQNLDTGAAWQQVQRPRLRWLLYRKVDQLPPTETVTLWAHR